MKEAIVRLVHKTSSLAFLAPANVMSAGLVFKPMCQEPIVNNALLANTRLDTPLANSVLQASFLPQQEPQNVIDVTVVTKPIPTETDVNLVHLVRSPVSPETVNDVLYINTHLTQPRANV